MAAGYRRKPLNIGAIVAALAIEGVVVFALVRGLAAHWADSQASETVLTAVNLRLPPAPPPEPVEKAAGSAAPAGPRSLVPAIPEPAVPLASPTPAPAAAGTAVAGAGSGAGGTGSGTGAGGVGTGEGSGRMSAPVRIAGALSDRDYPAAAGRAAGTVAIAFRVRIDGGVDSCRILATSSSVVLDGLTCSLVEKRFRYSPARDESGRPVAGTVRTTFTWGTRR